MITQPQFEQRNEQPYVALRTIVSMQEIGTKVPPLIPRVYSWLGEKGAQPAGALFFRYLRMEDGQLDLEIGVPVQRALDGDGEIGSATFPAGKYAVTRYRGPYDGLPKAWNAFEQWREEAGVHEMGQVTPDGAVRGARAEHYVVGPDDVQDPQQWETELVLYVGDDPA